MKIYPGAADGLCSTHKDQVNADLLAFLKAQRSASRNPEKSLQQEGGAPLPTPERRSSGLSSKPYPQRRNFSLNSRLRKPDVSLDSRRDIASDLLEPVCGPRGPHVQFPCGLRRSMQHHWLLSCFQRWWFMKAREKVWAFGGAEERGVRR